MPSSEAPKGAEESKARDAYEELNCDWPQLSAAEASALCSVLSASNPRASDSGSSASNSLAYEANGSRPSATKKLKVPGWFRMTDKFLRGVEYSCDSGFTKRDQGIDAAEGAERADGAEAVGDAGGRGVVEGDQVANADVGAGSQGSTSSLLVAAVLHPLCTLCDSDQKEICEALKGLSLAEDKALQPLFEVSEPPVVEGEVMAETEDEDDFEFEPIESSQGGDSLSALVPSQVEAETTEEQPYDWDRALCLLATLMRPLTYRRLAEIWNTERVGEVLMELLSRLLEHPAGAKCHNVVMHVTFLLRDRMIQEPESAGLYLKGLLKLFQEHPKDPFLPCLALHCCSTVVRIETPLHEKSLTEETIKLSKRIWESECEPVVRLLESRIGAWPKLGTPGEQVELQAIAQEEKAVCAISISILLGAAGQMGGSTLLRLGVLRGLLGRLIHKSYKAFYDEYIDSADSLTLSPIALVLALAVGCSSEAAAYLLKVQQLTKPDFDQSLFPDSARAAWGTFALLQSDKPASTAESEANLTAVKRLCRNFVDYISHGANDEGIEVAEMNATIGAEQSEGFMAYLRMVMVTFAFHPPARTKVFKKLPQLQSDLSQVRSQIQNFLTQIQAEMGRLKERQELLEASESVSQNHLAPEIDASSSSNPEGGQQLSIEAPESSRAQGAECQDVEGSNKAEQAALSAACNGVEKEEAATEQEALESKEVSKVRRLLLQHRKAKEITSRALLVLKAILLDQNSRKQD